MSNKYLVTSCSSLGYVLYDEKEDKNIIKKKPGKFKFKSQNIYIGDYVSLDDKNEINDIYERKNFLDRPKISNIDYLCIVTSLSTNNYSFLLDKFLTIANFKEIPTLIVFTKIDLLGEKLDEIKKKCLYYKKINYDVFFIDNKKNISDDYVLFKKMIKDKKIAFVGQTGVGKSTLINRLDEKFKRKIDDKKQTIDRGRHITKDISLLKYDEGYIFDTPGFSDFEINNISEIDLSVSFPGYNVYADKCKFTSCIHLESTPGCNIILNISKDNLSQESYQNYLKLIENIKENKR